MALATTETLKLPESGIRVVGVGGLGGGATFRSVITSATCSLNFTVLNNIKQGSQPAAPAFILCAARTPNIRTQKLRIINRKMEWNKKRKSISHCSLKQHSVNYGKKKRLFRHRICEALFLRITWKGGSIKAKKKNKNKKKCSRRQPLCPNM